MNRRNLLKTIAGLSVISFLPAVSQIKGIKNSSKPEIKKALRLKPGDTAAIISPGTTVTSPDDIQKAEEALSYFGLKMKLMPNTIKGTGYYSRSVEERVSDIHAAFRDESCKAVFCLRGGYGSQELLDSIEYNIIANNPKIFAGFSDITALLLAFYEKAGLITYHAPLLTSSFPEYTARSFKEALFGEPAEIILHNPADKSGIRMDYPLRTISAGKASGILTGGNLSIITTLLGTPFAPDVKGKLLFLEEVDERPYRIARMLNQLRLAGYLKDAGGIIFGKCSDCAKEDSQMYDFTVGEIADKYLSNLGIPVLYGMAIGHTDEMLTLPIGAVAELDADKGELRVTYKS